MKFATRERKDGMAMANEQEVAVETGISDTDIFSDAFGTPETSQKSAEQPDEIVTSGAGENDDAERVLEPEASDRERDEHGRFKAKASTQEQPKEAQQQTQDNPVEAAEPKPEATQQAQKDDEPGGVPTWRLREIREARDAERARADKAEQDARAAAAQASQLQQHLQAMQEQIQALRSPPKQPDPVNLFEDPDAFIGTWEQKLVAQEQSFQKQLRQMRLENNLSLAAMVHKDDFQPAYEAFTSAVEGGDKALATRVFGSSDPGGAMVAWHREHRTLKEIGTDPSAYVQSKLEEALKDPAFLARALEAAKAQAGGQSAAPAAQTQQSRPNTIVKRPPSLSGVPGGSSAHAGANGFGNSDRDVFNEALFSR